MIWKFLHGPPLAIYVLIVLMARVATSNVFPLCSAAAPEVRKRAMQGELWSTQDAQQDVLQTSSFLLSFFQCVCAMSQEHPCLVQTLAVCIGDYAAWFGRCPLPFTMIPCKACEIAQ